METVWKYAIAAGIIGLIPLSVIILIPLEIVMIYHLSVVNRRPFNLAELSIIWAILLFVGGFAHGVVGAVFVFFGPVGWIVKAGFAFGFVLAFGGLVNWYYNMENQKEGRLPVG
jgi:uncharacterized protein (DUF697 family)